MRVFIGERDKHDGVPLSEWIVQAAKKHGLTGATVVRGIEGFGAHSKIQSVKLLDMGAPLPVIVEMVDEVDKIQAFLPTLEAAVSEGIICLLNVELIVKRAT